MEISDRLKCVAALVDRCETAVDVGTDHGYIPIYLIKGDVCKKVIASDINRGPVDKARKNIALEGLSNKIDCRLGGGLTIISPKEVNCAIIAGMGGNLIRDIIEESLEVFKYMSFAVLQPVQNPEVLRKYIHESGYTILDEELCEDDNKFYEIIKISYNNKKPEILDDIYYEISNRLIQKKHPLLRKYIDFKVEKYERIYNFINEDTLGAQERKSEVKDRIQKLKEINKWL